MTTGNATRALCCALCLWSLFALSACGKKEASAPAKPEAAAQPQSTQPAAAPQETASQDDLPAPNSMMLPVNFNKHTGDLDDMVKRRNIRAIVMLNPIGFFYDQGHPRGVMYETMEEFQKFVNQKLKVGNPGIKVSFLPVTPAQAEAAITQGMGDIIAAGIVITPEREKVVAFSTPVITDVSQVVVGGPGFGQVNSTADLSGKTIYVNP